MLRAVTIRNYIALMNTRGFSEIDVLRNTGISPESLSDQDFLIDIGQCQAVIENMLSLSGDPGIGLEVAGLTSLADLGIVGYAALSCKNMRSTYSLWKAYGNSLVGMMSTLGVIRETEDEFCFGLSGVFPEPSIQRFCVDELIGMMVRVGLLLTGDEPPILHIGLAFDVPEYAHCYHSKFKCTIEFGCEETSVTLAREWLYRPLKSQDRELNEICLMHCSEVLKRIEDDCPIVEKIRLVFLKTPQNIPTLEEYAGSSGASVSTLKRQLGEAGTSYKQLVAEFRKDLAVQYIKSTCLSTKEIGYHLGYSDQSSFRRAFKSWTGKTPAEYRAP
jgi:AraC-like DNA-binding protein